MYVGEMIYVDQYRKGLNGLIKVISKPLGVDELLELAKKYSEIKI